MTSRVLIPVLSGLEQNSHPLVKQVVKGIKQINTQRIASQSNTLSQTSFNWQPPSQNSIIDRCFILEQTFLLTSGVADTFVTSSSATTFAPSTGTAGGITAASEGQTVGFRYQLLRVPVPILTGAAAVGQYTNITSAVKLWAVGAGARNLVIQNNFGPRQFPLANSMDSIDLSINGTHFSVSCNQYIQALMRYTTPEWREKNLGYTYHAPDFGASYDISDAQVNQIGTNLNQGQYCSLNLPTDGFRQGETPRGSIFTSSTADVTITTTTIQAIFREPIFISPLMSTKGHGMTNINQLDLTIRWNSGLKLSLFGWFTQLDRSGFNATGYTPLGTPATVLFSDFTVTSPSAQSYLYIDYYTAQDDVNIPNEIILAYKQPYINSQVMGTAQASPMGSNNVRLDQVPESVYIYIQRSTWTESAVNFKTADIFGRITSINIQWKNQTGILSGLYKYNIQALAQKNGMDATPFEQESCGTVLKLNFGEDIPLDDNESPGTRGDYNWQCDVGFDLGNMDVGTTQQYTLFFIFVKNGTVILSPNECRVTTGTLTLADAMNAQDVGHVYSSGVEGGSMVGGSEVGGSLIGGVVGHLKTIFNVGKHLVKAGMGAYNAAAPEIGQAVSAYRSRA